MRQACAGLEQYSRKQPFRSIRNRWPSTPVCFLGLAGRTHHGLPLTTLTGHPDFPEAAAEARWPSVSFAATKLPLVNPRLRPEAVIWLSRPKAAMRCRCAPHQESAPAKPSQGLGARALISDDAVRVLRRRDVSLGLRTRSTLELGFPMSAPAPRAYKGMKASPSPRPLLRWAKKIQCSCYANNSMALRTG